MVSAAKNGRSEGLSTNANPCARVPLSLQTIPQRARRPPIPMAFLRGTTPITIRASRPASTASRPDARTCPTKWNYGTRPSKAWRRCWRLPRAAASVMPPTTPQHGNIRTVTSLCATRTASSTDGTDRSTSEAPPLTPSVQAQLCKTRPRCRGLVLGLAQRKSFPIASISGRRTVATPSSGFWPAP